MFHIDFITIMVYNNRYIHTKNGNYVLEAIMNLKIDKNELRELLIDFNTLSNIKFVIFDTDFNEILSFPEENSPLCSIIRSNSEAKEKCDNCTKAAGNLCKEIGTVNIYTCHIGLVEAVAPLKVNSVVVGYVMFGQIINKDTETESIAQILKNVSYFYDYNIEHLLKADMYKTQSQIHAAAKLVETSIAYILTKNLIQIEKGGLPFMIEEYIESNLDKSISVDTICKQFKVSRNTVYQNAYKHFGMPIGEFIRKKRMDKAYDLLKSGMTVTEVAIKVGFSDYSYFTKSFKREKNMLPKQVKSNT